MYRDIHTILNSVKQSVHSVYSLQKWEQSFNVCGCRYSFSCKKITPTRMSYSMWKDGAAIPATLSTTPVIRRTQNYHTFPTSPASITTFILNLTNFGCRKSVKKTSWTLARHSGKCSKTECVFYWLTTQLC